MSAADPLMEKKGEDARAMTGQLQKIKKLALNP